MTELIEALKRDAKSIAILLDQSGQTEAAIELLAVVDHCDRAARLAK